MRVTVARAYELLSDAEFRRKFTQNPNNLENVVIEGLMTHPLASIIYDDSTFAYGSIKTRVILTNKLGLHARAANKFVILATGYKSAVRVIRDNRYVNGKSVMGLMMLAAICGTLLDIEAAGVDANEAVEGLKELVEHKFFENE